MQIAGLCTGTERKKIFPIWAVIEHFGPWNTQNGVEQRFSWLSFHINQFVGDCAQQTQLCHSEKDNGSEKQQQHFSKMTGGSGVSLDILWSCHTFRKHWSPILWNSGPLSQLRAKHIVLGRLRVRDMKILIQDNCVRGISATGVNNSGNSNLLFLFLMWVIFNQNEEIAHYCETAKKILNYRYCLQWKAFQGVCWAHTFAVRINNTQSHFFKSCTYFFI